MNLPSRVIALPSLLPVVLAIIIISSVACSKTAAPPKAAPSQPSNIGVQVHDGGPILLKTSEAEFQILPSGFLQATLIKDGKRLTLDEPEAGSSGGSDSIVLKGKELDFVPEFAQAKVVESNGKLGRGKRVELPAKPLAPAGVSVERNLVVEVFDDFPNIALVSTTYKNVGSSDVQVDKVLMQQHRFNATQVDAKAQPFDMWSFQGSSYDWGKDDVLKMTRASAQPNAMGAGRERRLWGRHPGRRVLDGIGWRSDRPCRNHPVDLIHSGEGRSRWSGECECRHSHQPGAQPRRDLLDSEEFPFRVQRRFL